ITVFQRSADERRRVPIQIFALRVAAGGAGVVPTPAGSQMWARDLRIIRENYERIGLSVSTEVAAGTPAANIVRDGTDSAVLIDPPAGVNPGAVDTAAETALSTSFPAIADTVRLFYVGRLTSGNRGEAWPEVDVPGAARAGSAYINAAITGTGPYSPAHELVHLLTNKSVTVNGGHYRAPTAPAGNRLNNNQNLMRGGTSTTEGVTESKRLWDAPDGDALNQFTVIRGSHFTRA
ncbi:MAG: hypothetical protein M3430_13660, partial [Acidobacteriota bacterium]|nr:hypothetical protein [Acidobacteriota bacterium]